MGQQTAALPAKYSLTPVFVSKDVLEHNHTYLFTYCWCLVYCYKGRIEQLQQRLQSGRPWFSSWVRKIPWRRNRLPTSVLLGFLCGSAGKESACNAGDTGSIPGSGRSPGEGKGYPLHCSKLENSMDSPWGHKEADTTDRLSLHFTNLVCKSFLA